MTNQAARSFQLKSRAATSVDQHSDTNFSAGDQFEASAEESVLEEDPADAYFNDAAQFEPESLAGGLVGKVGDGSLYSPIETSSQVHANPPFQLFFIPDLQMDIFWSQPEKNFLEFGETVKQMVNSAFGDELYKPLLKELAEKIRNTPELHLINEQWGIEQTLFQLAGYFLFPPPDYSDVHKLTGLPNSSCFQIDEYINKITKLNLQQKIFSIHSETSSQKSRLSDKKEAQKKRAQITTTS